MKMNVLVSAFISYSVLVHIKYSVLCFKLSVRPLMYDVKMKSGGCASPCSVLSVPLCGTGVTITLVLDRCPHQLRKAVYR
jgi:hypothetical protein